MPAPVAQASPASHRHIILARVAARSICDTTNVLQQPRLQLREPAGRFRPARLATRRGPQRAAGDASTQERELTTLQAAAAAAALTALQSTSRAHRTSEPAAPNPHAVRQLLTCNHEHASKHQLPTTRGDTRQDHAAGAPAYNERRPLCSSQPLPCQDRGTVLCVTTQPVPAKREQNEHRRRDKLDTTTTSAHPNQYTTRISESAHHTPRSFRAMPCQPSLALPLIAFNSSSFASPSLAKQVTADYSLTAPLIKIHHEFSGFLLSVSAFQGLPPSRRHYARG
ncbi:hypothetical protein DFH06DRAFT_1336275 [Mycena polygramma]|nr:hypothetical protein DFH06DRAFT_1336275 [Mycena polygramma]